MCIVQVSCLIYMYVPCLIYMCVIYIYVPCVIHMYDLIMCIVQIQPIAFGVSFNRVLQSQSNWWRFNLYKQTCRSCASYKYRVSFIYMFHVSFICVSFTYIGLVSTERGKWDLHIRLSFEIGEMPLQMQLAVSYFMSHLHICSMCHLHICCMCDVYVCHVYMYVSFTYMDHVSFTYMLHV